MSTLAFVGATYPPEACRGHSQYLYCGAADCPQRSKIESMSGSVIGSGDLAYADTFSGLLPCKIVSVVDADDRPVTTIVTVRLTASRKAYRRGEVIEFPPSLVIPRKCVHSRSGNLRINPNYVIRRDSEKKEDSK